MEQDGKLSLPDLSVNQTGDQSLHYINGTKWLLDGTPLERLAEMKVDYKDKEGWKGKMNFMVADIDRMIAEANKRNDPLMVHAVGDATILAFLNTLDKTNAKGSSLLRPRIEHGDGLLPDLFDIAKRNNVVVVQNPTHLSLVAFMHARWQGEMEKHGQPLKSLLKAGIPVAIGSDGPLNPYLNIMLACMHPFQPTEALTVEEAVIAYTRTSAYAEFAESYKGTLSVGKVADLVVLSQDIFTIPLPQLPGTSSVLTMIDGKVVYKK
jgi:predicted amidohydrolase YtcJ